MCTYLTEKLDVEGSGKGAAGWFTLSQASVYLDHPQHAPAEHTLNIDFLNPQQGPSARVAVELTAQSARALAAAIESTLAAAPPGLVCRPGPGRRGSRLLVAGRRNVGGPCQDRVSEGRWHEVPDRA